MNCKIGKIEWFIVIFLTITLDVVQVILTALAIGLVLNRFIDIIVGFLLPAYFWKRGVNMKSGKNWTAFIAGFLLEFFGLGGDDGLPFWTLEVLVVCLTVNAEKLRKIPGIGKAVTMAQQRANGKMNIGGSRQPSGQNPPVNDAGSRVPIAPLKESVAGSIRPKTTSI